MTITKRIVTEMIFQPTVRCLPFLVPSRLSPSLSLSFLGILGILSILNILLWEGLHLHLPQRDSVGNVY
jgi:hypothetical protein